VLPVDDYGDIRRADRDGMSIKGIARELGYARDTIRKLPANPEPNPTPQVRNRTAPVLGPFFTITDQSLRDDDPANGWSDEEVVLRWGRLFPPRDKSRQPLPVFKRVDRVASERRPVGGKSTRAPAKPGLVHELPQRTARPIGSARS
jgi:hypothetical protein